MTTPLYGVDFTSSPRRAKPITVAHGHLDGARVELVRFEHCVDWPGFEALLARPGPWLGAFDFPFGLPREAIADLDWPQTWPALVRHCATLGKPAFRAALDAYRESRPVGRRYAHRATDLPARSHSPLKLVNPPVGLMFLEGAPRLLAAGVRVPGMHDGDPSRVAIEAYPGLLARRITPASYKSDERRKQNAERHAARKQIIDTLTVGPVSSQGASRPLVLAATREQHQAMLDDASGDLLDASWASLPPHRNPVAPGQGHRERRPPGHRGRQRQGRDHRRQEGQVRAAGRGRPGRPAHRHHGGPAPGRCGVKGVVGHLNSGASIPASRIYEQAGMPQVSPSSTNPKLTQQNFKPPSAPSPTTCSRALAIGKYATEVLGQAIRVIDDRTAYGQGLADEVEKAVKANGGAGTGREFTTDKATDFLAILTKLKAANPDVIFYGGMDAQAGPMLKQMKQLGITAKFLTGDGGCTAEMIKLAGAAVEQHLLHPGRACPWTRCRAARLQRALQEALQRADVQLYAPYAYDAASAIIEAMKAADSADPAKYLPRCKKCNFPGVIGNVAFDASGDIKDGAVTVYQLQGRRLGAAVSA
jgi:branched-chain amino acid transport system substrate-binding protein